MGLRLYNTMGRKLEEFEPITPGKVGFYGCGPTVYNYAHIGNLRAYPRNERHRHRPPNRRRGLGRG